jgi:hypothetical protein
MPAHLDNVLNWFCTLDLGARKAVYVCVCVCLCACICACVSVFLCVSAYVWVKGCLSLYEWVPVHVCEWMKLGIPVYMIECVYLLVCGWGGYVSVCLCIYLYEWVTVWLLCDSLCVSLQMWKGMCVSVVFVCECVRICVPVCFCMSLCMSVTV